MLWNCFYNIPSNLVNLSSKLPMYFVILMKEKKELDRWIRCLIVVSYL